MATKTFLIDGPRIFSVIDIDVVLHRILHRVGLGDLILLLSMLSFLRGFPGPQNYQRDDHNHQHRDISRQDDFSGHHTTSRTTDLSLQRTKPTTQFNTK